MAAEVMSSEALVLDTGKDTDVHNLENTWCLWVLMHAMHTHRKANPKDQWQNSNTCVHSFSTVEDFWCLYNNIHGPAQLFHGDLSFFKKDIAPAWEDETCAKGGRWLVKLEEKSRSGGQEITRMKQDSVEETWLNLILALIGETFGGDDNDLVCGAVLSSRAKGSSKLALWVKTTDQNAVLRLGKRYQQILRMTMKDSEGTMKDAMGFENFEKKAYTFHLDV